MTGAAGGRPAPWTVAEFSRRTGIPSSTLRYWDDEGLLCAERQPNGHRRYHEGHLPALEMVQMCQALGATIEETKLVLTSGDQGQRAAFAARTLPLVRARIQSLTAAVTVLEHVAVCTHPDAASCGAFMREAMPGPGPSTQTRAAGSRTTPAETGRPAGPASGRPGPRS